MKCKLCSTRPGREEQLPWGADARGSQQQPVAWSSFRAQGNISHLVTSILHVFPWQKARGYPSVHVKVTSKPCSLPLTCPTFSQLSIKPGPWYYSWFYYLPQSNQKKKKSMQVRSTINTVCYNEYTPQLKKCTILLCITLYCTILLCITLYCIILSL